MPVAQSPIMGADQSAVIHKFLSHSLIETARSRDSFRPKIAAWCKKICFWVLPLSWSWILPPNFRQLAKAQADGLLFRESSGQMLCQRLVGTEKRVGYYCFRGRCIAFSFDVRCINIYIANVSG